jgi:class 3 adenylate cyclase
VTLEFAGVHGWAKPAEAGERFVTTLLVTDIVDSTKVAVRLGDAAWKELLARHNEGVRIQLDRFRGVEVYTTGDGFLAFFDGAARAVRCAAALRDGALQDGLQIRAGVHSGEVERDAGNLRGVAVHAVTRIAALPILGMYSFQRRRRACSKARASRWKTLASTSSRGWPAPAASTDSSGSPPTSP